MSLQQGAQAPALGHQLEKTKRKWDVRELTACCGGGELLKQHMPPSAPLLSACELYTLQVFVFNSLSFSFTFLGDFLSSSLCIFPFSFTMSSYPHGSIFLALIFSLAVKI